MNEPLSWMLILILSAGWFFTIAIVVAVSWWARLLLKEKQRLEFAIQGASDGLWDWNIATNQVWYSTRLKQLLGYTDHEFPNHLKSWESHLHPEDRDSILRALDLHIKGNELYDVEYRLKIKDGNYRWFRARGEVVQFHQGKAVRMAGSIRDITERKKIVDDLRKTTEALQDEQRLVKELAHQADGASQVKGMFLASMSHEIRTPMNSILGFSNLLKNTPLDERQMEFVRTIESSGKMLLELINDILDFSKLEAGKMELEEINFDLAYLISDILKMVRARFVDKPIDVYIDIAPDVPHCLKGDPTRLKQIIMNLLSNAYKFTAQGAIGVKVANERVDAASKECVVRFEVKDSGIGIAKDKHTLIFEAFSQADSSTTRKFGGTGLGLAICRSLTTAMQGNIWVESTLGQGSSFIFTAHFKMTEPVSGQDISPLSPADLKGKKAVIIDSNEISLDVLKRYSQDIGLDIVLCSLFPKDALNYMGNFSNKNIDLVLCDIKTLKVHENQFIEKLRSKEYYRSLKTIAMTDDLIAGTSGQAQKEGFNGFLPKPIIKEELRNVIAAVLGDRRSEGQIITRHMAEELSCKGVKILVVDDVDSNLKLMKVFLGQLGCESDLVSSGKEAIEKIKTAEYDLCLLDMQMPEMSGDETTQIIRKEINQTLPIIALTAGVIKEDQEKCLQSGMNDFLGKPVDMVKLKNVILKYGRKI